MVRPDTSDSSIKTIHINSRKAIEIWKKWRRRGENLSERITNWLIQEDEKEQQALGTTDSNDNNNPEEEEENRIRPRLDLYFAVDPRYYKNMARWRFFFSHSKPVEIADAYDMLEYDLNMLRPRAMSYKREQEREKEAFYRKEREEQRLKAVAAEQAMLQEHEQVHKPKVYEILDDPNNPPEVNEERAKKYVESIAEKCPACHKVHTKTLQAQREQEREEEQKQQQY